MSGKNETEGASAPTVTLDHAAEGGRIKGIIVLGIALMAIIVVVASYVATARRAATTPEGAKVSGMTPPAGRATSPRSDPSEQYLDLINEENAIRLDSARGSGQPVVMAPLVGAGREVVRETTPRAAPVVTVERDRTDDITRRTNALRELKERWNALPRQGVVKGGAVAVQPATGSDTAGTETVVDLGIPALTVLNAVVEVGANTDYPAELVVRLSSGPAAGARLLGRTQSAGGQGQVSADRVMMRFDRMLWRNHWYDVTAIAVDPGTRIPAVEGDINRHIVHNVIHEAGAAFLVGYASGSRATNPYIGVNVNPDGSVQSYNPYRSGDLLRATGAETLASSLRDGTYRRPTVTLAAGSAVGIVLTGPVREAGTAFSSSSQLATRPSAVNAGRFDSGVFRSQQGPTTTFAPDGTPITVGGDAP